MVHEVLGDNIASLNGNVSPQDIYGEKIYPSLLGDLTPQDKPKAIFLIAQPGAGKSRLLNSIVSNAGMFVRPAVISADELDYYDPAFSNCFLADPFKLTGFDTGNSDYWFERLFQEAKESRLNLVIEVTPKLIPQILIEAEALRKMGYGSVSVECIAVHYKWSEVGVVRRVERALSEGVANTHWIPVRWQLHQHEALSRSMEILQRAKVINDVHVYNRDGQCLNLGENPRKLAQGAVDRERERPWTQQEKERYCQQWVEVERSLNSRPNTEATKPNWYVQHVQEAIEAARELIGLNGTSPLLARTATPS